MSELIKTQLNFGGFYNTIHSSIVEDAVAFDLGAIDECNENDWENEDLINFSNWDAYKVEYCKEWVKLLNAELETNIVFTDLDSPREYNFETDVIIAHITVKDTLALFKLIKENELKDKVYKQIKKATTSSASAGYGAIYNYADIFKAEHRYFLVEIMIDILLEYREVVDTMYVEEFYPNVPTEEVA